MSVKGRNDFDLSGKVALITGGARGIGLHIANGFARYGASIVICDILDKELGEAKEEIQSHGGKVVAYKTDVTQMSQLKALVDNVEKEFGRIDILVNNAGRNEPQWAEDVTEEAWDKTFDLNLKAPFFLAQLVGKIMIRQKKGKIINISSQAGSVGMIKRAVYCSTKGGLNQLTRVLATEWAKHNINVNAVSPTFVETKMSKPMLEDEEFRDYVFDNLLLKKYGSAEDIVGGAIYLASSASDLVTGNILMVDGGWTAH
jgi:NAD(P)-dependent dehydrogenase (short-subunit alcohol dehydrogenase family)